VPPDGQYLKIVVDFTRSSTDDDGDDIKDSPILYDLSVAHNQPPVANAGPDQEVEQTSLDGAEVVLDGSASTDDSFIEPLTYSWNWGVGGSATGVSPTVTFPLGKTTVTLTVFDGQFSDTDTVDITVVDTTAPELVCVESVNPHGKTVPGEGRDKNGKGKQNVNPDGFYEILASDICDAEPELYIGTTDDPDMFGPFDSGIVIKFTEAPGADPSCKKIGSSNGQAGAVTWHITLPADPVVKDCRTEEGMSIVASPPSHPTPLQTKRIGSFDAASWYQPLY
jgi:hypothetical protein